MPQTKKNNLLDVQNERYSGIFESLREREREREREEGERESKSERERKTEKDKEREQKCGNYIFKLPWAK